MALIFAPGAEAPSEGPRPSSSDTGPQRERHYDALSHPLTACADASVCSLLLEQAPLTLGRCFSSICYAAFVQRAHGHEAGSIARVSSGMFVSGLTVGSQPQPTSIFPMPRSRSIGRTKTKGQAVIYDVPTVSEEGETPQQLHFQHLEL